MFIKCSPAILVAAQVQHLFPDAFLPGYPHDLGHASGRRRARGGHTSALALHASQRHRGAHKPRHHRQDLHSADEPMNAGVTTCFCSSWSSMVWRPTTKALWLLSIPSHAPMPRPRRSAAAAPPLA
ncbi:hypothetical protein SETIT_9G495100v2 [Setaria italica]|uniref:Uncharacterized protein n=1 Tax=Setaria italica TaxID=4555 RepID=A0A368SUA5_SETIT|nr:hypothetical protein SETIT_9G495100v2 [Setaria italica]